MNLSLLVAVSSIAVLASCAAAPPNAHYNRRAYPPPKFFYSHKGGFSSGPPINKYRPPGFRATRNPYIGPGPGQGIQHQGLPAQGIPQVLHQGPPQGLYQGVPQGIHQGPIGFNQGAPHGLHQVSQHQGVHHPLAQAPHPGHPYQQVPHQSQLFQSSPAKRFTPTPQTFVKTSPIPQFTSIAPWKIQPSHLNSIKNDLISEAPSFTVATKTYYKPDDERSPIHTIPAPKLSPADKPADFEYRIQQQTTQQQYPTTPGFKTLDKAIANQIKINPAALLAQQTQSHFAPDPDPQHVPQVRIPPTSDPFSQPSNGQVPIDIYLQQQIDNEIAQQEALYIQQQRAKEAMQYQQQQLEAAQLAIAQQQAFHAQQENLKQQLLQQQALEAQKQLALQAQQQAALQQAVLQQQQQQQIYQEVPVQQQSSESLTAEELFNLMHGIPAKNQADVQASTQSVQDVLSVPQQQNNEIASAATTNFQPNYQSFNYDEKAHQQQIQVEQQKEYSEGSESKRSTSEGVAQTNFNPQYQNFNYDEKTKRNGFNNENNEVGVQSQLQVDEVTQNTTKVEPKDIKKEKRYQKNAFSASHGYTVGYSTLPKDITESVPQTQFNLQQGGYSTLPVNYNEKQISRKVKPDNAVVNEIKKVHSGHLKKKTKYHNNGYSTIAEDLLQQHDLKNDLQQLTYSTLPNQKILEVLKHQRHFNSTQQQDQQTVTTEKDTLQKMRENAQKFYNPHILQAVRNNTGSDNVQIQQSIQIYENNYASKGDDNHIDLSGITTTSTTTPASTPVSTTSELSVVTEINVIESNHDSDNQESNLYEEIMLQDESKPLEDHYNSNSHSYFGQRIRPKRT